MTENPNIATLREALSSVVQARESGSRVASGELTIQAVIRAHAALDALATTLAKAAESGKYAYAIGQIESAIGINGAPPLEETVAKVRALVSTLAEKEARIRELEEGNSAFLADVRDELRLKPGDSLLSAVQALKNRAEARLAVPEGELKRDLTTVRRWLYEEAMPQSSVEALDAVVRAASSWSRLQWFGRRARRP